MNIGEIPLHMRRDGRNVAKVNPKDEFSLVSGGSYDVVAGESTVIGEITYNDASLKVELKDTFLKAKFRVFAETKSES